MNLKIEFSEHNDKTSLKNAIANIPYVGGGTNTDEALDLAAQGYKAENGARPGGASPVAIVFTDGYSQSDPKSGNDNHLTETIY